ncbi:MAG TPA: MauE/DoxX family redox-associated membrane protein [Thermoanaerobaculia bacterium]|nr:MauE/DoxX family redox-associated membrane protein [Thermoanaerobaculia bacterium]
MSQPTVGAAVREEMGSSSDSRAFRSSARGPIRDFLSSPWLTIRVQIALGVIFILAALPKIVDPPSFAHMIYNYRLVPGALLNPIALVLPWLELLCGLGLVLGIWKGTCRTIVGLMLVAFIIAIAINLARGNAIDCGCFDVSAAGKSRSERLADMRLVIARDLGMLLMVWQLWFARRAGVETHDPS